jgi:hypothetical protein
MGKVISIMRNGAKARAEERDPFLFDDSFFLDTEELAALEVDEDLFKRITYEMIESELSVPLVKPMWPLCSSF